MYAALGLEARAPHPQGYELEAGDLSGLERVKARGRLLGAGSILKAASGW